MGPVRSKRLEAGRGELHRLPHLLVFHRRVRAVSTLVTPLALHGVALAPVMDGDLAKLETLVLWSVWGGHQALPGQRGRLLCLGAWPPEFPSHARALRVHPSSGWRGWRGAPG